MKSITFFITSLSSGGAEHQLVELSKLLRLKGYSITIVTFADTVDHYSVPVGVLRKRLVPNKSHYSKAVSIFKYFLKCDTDCVISFGNRESLFSMWSMFFRPRLKYIVGERNLFTGKVPFLKKVMDSLLYKRATYIVPNSVSQSNFIKSNYSFVTGKVHTIQNFTDLNHFIAQQYPCNAKQKIAVFARYHSTKNYLRLVSVVGKLRDKGYDFSLAWYGNQYFQSEENPCYLEMKKKVKELGLEKIIFMYDHVKDVRTTMIQYDAICLPSLKEGFSNAISEAICCAKPMLVSRVSDNPTMVRDGENGFLFDPENETEMEKAFECFLQLSIDELKCMSRNSRRIAESLFDANAFVTKYITLIES